MLAIVVLHAVFGDLIAAYPAVTTALRVLVALYLLAAAFELWTRQCVPEGPAAGVGFDRVFVTTLLNPKAVVFAFGVIPLSAPGAAYYVAAFAVFVMMAALGWIAVGALVGRTVLRSRSRLISRASGVILTFFAGLIAVG